MDRRAITQGAYGVPMSSRSIRRQIIPITPAATSRIASPPRIRSGRGNASASPGFSLSSAWARPFGFVRPGLCAVVVGVVVVVGGGGVTAAVGAVAAVVSVWTVVVAAVVVVAAAVVVAVVAWCCAAIARAIAR